MIPLQIYCDYLEDKGIDCRLFRLMESEGITVTSIFHNLEGFDRGDGDEYGFHGNGHGNGYGNDYWSGNGHGNGYHITYGDGSYICYFKCYYGSSKGGEGAGSGYGYSDYYATGDGGWRDHL